MIYHIRKRARILTFRRLGTDWLYDCCSYITDGYRLWSSRWVFSFRTYYTHTRMCIYIYNVFVYKIIILCSRQRPPPDAASKEFNWPYSRVGGLLTFRRNSYFSVSYFSSISQRLSVTASGANNIYRVFTPVPGSSSIRPSSTSQLESHHCSHFCDWLNPPKNALYNNTIYCP